MGNTFEEDNRRNTSTIGALRRCTSCVLPETVPFIEFDREGVCNYCRGYRRLELKGEAAFEELVAPYRGSSGGPDCLVLFSGGRDSSYGLHYLKTVLKMSPVAYSYDWGMTTGLAYRNQARMCQKLGIKHVLVSADLKKKRIYIRKNVEAWLKRPDLGTVPLFMAGDKQFFYYANRLRRRLGVKLVFWSANPAEKTDFKSGFCGVRPQFAERSVYALPFLSKLRLASYYARQYLVNPSYLNVSLLNTLSAYVSYYLIPHHYISLYHYIRWEEGLIVSTLVRKYGWEMAEDTSTTWRIGDGTAAFYNYIYYTMAGFTENDTFRSNQIREGMLTRERALELVKRENQPRFDSIRWYCDTVGLDFNTILGRINSAPKLYDGLYPA